MAEAVKKEEVKKGPLGKLKEAVDDKEEQMAILSTFVRPVSYTHLRAHETRGTQNSFRTVWC